MQKETQQGRKVKESKINVYYKEEQNSVKKFPFFPILYSKTKV